MTFALWGAEYGRRIAGTPLCGQGGDQDEVCTNSPPVTPGGRSSPARAPRGRGHADVGDPELAGVRAPSPPRRRPRFIAVSVQVSVALHRRVECLAGGGIQTARDVDAEDWNPRPVERSDRARLGLAGRAAQPGAKDRVNDQFGVPDTTRRTAAGSALDDHVDAAASAPTRRGRARHRSPAPRRRARATRTAHPQVARCRRGDQSVASVVAIPGDNADTGRPPQMAPRTPRNLPSGDLHELERGHAALRGRGVEARHVLRRELAERLRRSRGSRSRQLDLHGVTRARTTDRHGAGAAAGNLEVTGAADQRARIRRRCAHRW